MLALTCRPGDDRDEILFFVDGKQISVSVRAYDEAKRRVKVAINAPPEVVIFRRSALDRHRDNPGDQAVS